MRSHALIFSIVCLALSGCASTLRVQPVAGPDQQTMYIDGTEAIVSKKRSVVAVRPSSNTYTSEQRPTFIVSVFNGTEKPIVFSTEDITASAAGTLLKVFSYDELVAEVENQRNRAVVAAALSAMAQSMIAAQAGNQYTYGSYNTNYYSSQGYSGYGYGTYSAYTYNPAAAVQAQAAANTQAIQNLEYINASADAALSDLRRKILKKKTVLPNEWHGGYFKLQQAPIPEISNSILLKILFGDEAHSFEFMQTKVK